MQKRGESWKNDCVRETVEHIFNSQYPRNTVPGVFIIESLVWVYLGKLAPKYSMPHAHGSVMFCFALLTVKSLI